jgi:hypothetical protein
MTLLTNGIPRSVNLSGYRAEPFEDELIIYNVETHRIITFNSISAFIWNSIVVNAAKDETITDGDLAALLLQEFKTDDNLDDVINEVRNFVDLIIAEKLI